MWTVVGFVAGIYVGVQFGRLRQIDAPSVPLPDKMRGVIVGLMPSPWSDQNVSTSKAREL
jgi:hypothetical protein